eukprot:CAMPEP_0178421442 /NCGR_PEP_ID=MMETSP0689_2-20121128/26648_1 /TAXON_ID=160604 /ORGANISM="Amphidinium massartii, Strain CS-259" /LENGTH=514 /DNA_ID=CAMNT_0020042951 /DNA_START=73 /DNA_END=1617 /DNA_ORIENTATION=-
MALCDCEFGFSFDDIEDMSETATSSTAPVRSNGGMSRCSSFGSLSDFCEWVSCYNDEDDDSDEELQTSRWCIDSDMDACDEVTGRGLQSVDGQAMSVAAGPSRRKMGEAERRMRLSPRDLQKAIRKAEALRTQLEGRRRRVCELFNAPPAPAAPAAQRKKKKVQKVASESFDACRRRLLRQCLSSIKSDLMVVPATSAPGWVACNSVEIIPVPLATHVEERFMAAQQSAIGARLRMTYHGTDNKNLISIFEKGLLPPGSVSGVAVANGQSHGQGVYTARLGQVGSTLALSFCRRSVEPLALDSDPGGACAAWNARIEHSALEPPGAAPPRPRAGVMRDLLLCGVLDDSVPVPHTRVGNHTLTAKSDHVSHVSDAVIVGAESYIAPMFVARVTEDLLWTRGGGVASSASRADTARGPVRRKPRLPAKTVTPRQPKPRDPDTELFAVWDRLHTWIDKTEEVIGHLRKSQSKIADRDRRAQDRRSRMAARQHKQREVLGLWTQHFHSCAVDDGDGAW